MRRLIVAFALAAAGTAARADDGPLCADRPAKANAPCTVPDGRWQVETALVDQLDYGADGRTVVVGASAIKVGLDGRSDLEAVVIPYVHTAGAGGVGDLTLRYKRRLSADGAPVQLALVPWLKLPVARRPLGNGAVEGGIALPLSFALGGPLTLTLGPEVDVLADGDGAGRHGQLVQVANLAVAVAPRLTLVAEGWGAWNFDPAGTVRQASADVAAAYAVSDRLVLDAGANIGLTRATADIELTAGVSARF